MAFDGPNSRGSILYLYDLVLRAMMFAAQNYKEAVRTDYAVFIIRADCGDIKIELHVWDITPKGKRGTVKVDDGTGLIVLDSEVNLLDINEQVIVNTYIRGDWENWVPVPLTWVRPIGL